MIIAGEESVNDIGDDGDEIGEWVVKSSSEVAVEERTKIIKIFLVNLQFNNNALTPTQYFNFFFIYNLLFT